MCLCLHVSRMKFTVQQNQNNFQIQLIVCLVSIAVEISCLFTAESTIMTLFCLFLQSERNFQTCGSFDFSVQNNSSRLTVSQTTKKQLFILAFPPSHKTARSLSIFLLTVSIVLIMHGAWVQPALLLILLR